MTHTGSEDLKTLSGCFGLRRDSNWRRRRSHVEAELEVGKQGGGIYRAGVLLGQLKKKKLPPLNICC